MSKLTFGSPECLDKKIVSRNLIRRIELPLCTTLMTFHINETINDVIQ